MMSIKSNGGVFGRHPTFQSVSAESYQIEPGGIVTDATTARTLTAADNGITLYFTSGSAVTVTTAAGLGKGFSCSLIQGGAGEITISQGASTSLISFGGINSTDGQYSTASLFCPADDTFLFSCTRNTKAAVQYLLAAGGGGGASSFDQFGGGGGGAGGYLAGSGFELTVKTTLPITLGAGGAGGLAIGTIATQGSNSVLSTLTAIGGGRGGQPIFGDPAESGGNGGSGGGGAGRGGGGAVPGGSGTSGQGFAGGAGSVGGQQFAGAGGGATGIGGTSLTVGAGAANSITGSSVTYSTGGRGGGAAGYNEDGPSGAANTGNGGGGPYRTSGQPHRPGGNGGSGFIVIKVPSWVTATFSAGVTFTLNTSVSGFNIYQVTATSTTNETVTLEP